MPLADHFDIETPKSLFAMLPHWIQTLCEELDDELLEKTSWELTKELFPDGIPAAPTYLRIAFWHEYARASQNDEEVMNFINVHKSFYSIARIRKLLTEQKAFLAWLLKKPPTYDEILEELTELGLRRQVEAMRLPILNDKGTPNVKLIEAQARIFQQVDVRLKGAITQKIEQKTLNVNVDGNKQLPAGRQLTLAAVNEELDRLRKISELLQAPANVKLDAGKLITGETMEAGVSHDESPTPVSTANQPKIESDTV